MVIRVGSGADTKHISLLKKNTKRIHYSYSIYVDENGNDSPKNIMENVTMSFQNSKKLMHTV
jgi:hypothetical protein